ncbi:MAG: hypothetical protein QM537_03705, partial [Candidatus Symbiobacter sp.]|nr:hypothetical protein [Candidatus Symbiobacter sp.]
MSWHEQRMRRKSVITHQTASGFPLAASRQKSAGNDAPVLGLLLTFPKEPLNKSSFTPPSLEGGDSDA